MSFRTLIEIWFPYQYAPQVSDFLIWFVPTIFWLTCVWLFKEYIKSNLVWCIAGAVVVYFAYIYSYANTQYKWDWDDPRADGCGHTFVWLNEPAKAEAESGQITWEEYYWRYHLLLRVGQDLVLEGAMPISEFKGAAYPLRDYFRDRDDRLRNLHEALAGGSISHWAYRKQIDKMNEETFAPWQSYVEMRDAEQAKWRNVILLPVFYSVVAFFAFGFIFKPIAKWGAAWMEIRNKTRFEKSLTGFTHARSLDELASVDGPLKLAYPLLFVGDVPHDLSRSHFDLEHPNLLHLGKTGSRLFLYSGGRENRKHSDPAIPKRKFFFHEGPSPKPKINPPIVTRKSIFQEL